MIGPLLDELESINLFQQIKFFKTAVGNDQPSDDQLEDVARIEANSRRCLDIEDVVQFESDAEVDENNEPDIENVRTQTTINNINSTYSE
jgi:hypothetical protein